MYVSPIPTAEILFATDFCEPSRRALVCARQIARLRGSLVRAIHVLDLTGGAPADQRSFSAARDSAERMLREIRRELRLSGIREAATLITAGRPARALRDAATQYQAGLLILGINGTRSRKSSTLGTTARTLLAHPPCPLLTVSPAYPEHHSTDSFARPFFVTDGTSEALQTAFLAWPFSASPSAKQSAPPLCTVLSPGRSKDAKVPLDIQSRFAPVRSLQSQDAIEIILRAASGHRAGLIVFGLSAGEHLDSLARGTFAHALITGALCPVLTVKA